MTAFPRNQTHTSGVPAVNGPRMVSALLHLTYPFFTYCVMYSNTNLLSQYLTIHALADNRKALFLFLNTFYGVRWAIGSLTMLGQVDMSTAVMLGVLHLPVHELFPILAAMTFGPSGELMASDYFGAFLVILGGIFQHGSELQRYFFKMDTSNKGKLHTTGLFALARGINHTGHVLHDIGYVFISPFNPTNLLLLQGDYQLLMKIVPETFAHMKKKYGEQYEAYAKATPAKYIPGIW